MIGYITKLSVESIHVPLKHRQKFDAILVEDKSKLNEFSRPRYKVELAYGSRSDPWIVSVQLCCDSLAVTLTMVPTTLRKEVKLK